MIMRIIGVLMLGLGLLPAVHSAETQASALSAPPPNSDSFQPSGALMLCATAPLKAFLVFSVGEARLWRADCSVKWPDGADQPLIIDFHYTRDIPAHAFREAAENFLKKNGVELTPALEAFNGAYRNVKEGDTYQLAYAPPSGLTLSLNGERLARLKGDAGWQYFAIWLGERPFNASLKARLLGTK